MFDPIVNVFVQALIWMTTQFEAFPLPPWLSAYALALIAMAILVKTVTYPLTATQLRSMREMQRVQPELKRLQKKYKDDRETLARKQMELYKEHGVNPFGGCLPLLIQLPVLWGLFRAITDERLTSRYHEGFLWVQDLSMPEPLPWDADPGIPILIILMIASQFLYQQFMTPPSTGDGDSQADAMRSVMKFSPLFFAFIFISLPAGLVLYYLTFNVTSVLQQSMLNRESGAEGLTLPVSGGEDEEGDEDNDGQEAESNQEQSAHESSKRRRRRKKVR